MLRKLTYNSYLGLRCEYFMPWSGCKGIVVDGMGSLDSRMLLLLSARVDEAEVVRLRHQVLGIGGWGCETEGVLPPTGKLGRCTVHCRVCVCVCVCVTCRACVRRRVRDRSIARVRL